MKALELRDTTPLGTSSCPLYPKLIKMTQCTGATAYSASISRHLDEDELYDDETSRLTMCLNPWTMLAVYQPQRPTHPKELTPPPPLRLGGYLHASQNQGKTRQNHPPAGYNINQALSNPRRQ